MLTTCNTLSQDVLELHLQKHTLKDLALACTLTCMVLISTRSSIPNQVLQKIKGEGLMR